VKGQAIAGLITLLLIAGTVAGVLAQLHWAAARARPRSDPRRGIVAFRSVAALRWGVPLVAVGFSSFIGLALYHDPPRDFTDWCGVITAVLMAGGIFAWAWDAIGFGLVITPQGLDCHSPWRGRRFVEWEEVTALTYFKGGPYFVIHTHGGYRFRVHLHVGGLGQFLKCMEQHLDAAALNGAKAGYEWVKRPFPDPLRRGSLDLTRWSAPVDSSAVCGDHDRVQQRATQTPAADQRVTPAAPGEMGDRT
jgi:hypothetical protein